MTTCPSCHRPTAILLVITGRGGSTEMCTRCYFAPLRGPSVIRKVGPAKDHSRQRPRQGSH